MHPLPVCDDDGTLDCSYEPVCRESLRGAVAVDLDLYHSCAMVADGTVRCWGYRHPWANATGNAMWSMSFGSICRPLTACSSGGGDGCVAGTLYQSGTTRTCELIEAVMP